MAALKAATAEAAVTGRTTRRQHLIASAEAAIGKDAAAVSDTAGGKDGAAGTGRAAGGRGAAGRGRGGCRVRAAEGMKRKATRFAQIMRQKFQVVLADKWEDYSPKEDDLLKKAYLVGHPNAEYSFRGHRYLYDFQSMTQLNKGTGKSRQIRAPPGLKQPAEPELPPGPMVVIPVPSEHQGYVEVSNPQDPTGEKVKVQVPEGAKPGSQMVAPVPSKGETVADVARKQGGWSTKKGWSTKALVAAGVGGGAVVGGVVLGDHLADGAMSDWASGAAADLGEWAEDAGVVDAAEDVGDFTVAAGEDVGDWAVSAAEDVGGWTEEAAEDAGTWFTGDAADWVDDAADDTGAWLADAGEDFGDFIMDLF